MKRDMDLPNGVACDFVAPRRGAWIETGVGVTLRSWPWASHPAGVRGLKQR